MRNLLKIGDETIAPGEHKLIKLPLPELYVHSSISMPVQVIHGRKPGPRLFISAAIHGDEINGVEIIRRLLRTKYMKQMKGTLLAVPVVNVFGFISQARYLPDRRDLNRAFPGSAKGSMASRIAHTFMKEIVTGCTHGIDLHTGTVGRENFPHIRAKVVDASETEKMAKAFGIPVILNAEFRDGSLRQAVFDYNIPVLLYESGEALRFDEISIRAGVRGIIGVMSHIGMLPSRRGKKEPTQPLIAKSSVWVRAPHSGILRSVLPLGGKVEKDETLAVISHPFGLQEYEVKSTASGIIIGEGNLPLVHEGEALFNIASFSKPKNIEEIVDNFHDQIDPLTTKGPSGEPPII